MTDFDSVLDRLQGLFLGLQQQHQVSGLKPPAHDAQIAAVEGVLGYALPPDVRALYLRFNGQGAEGWSFFPPFFSIPTLEELLDQWQSDSDMSREADRIEALDMVEEPSKLVVIPYWASPRRLLVGKSGMPVFLYCDLDPGPAGVLGQIIHQDVLDEPRLMANSFAEAINMIVTAAERGTIRYDPGAVGWVRQDGTGLYGDFSKELAL